MSQASTSMARMWPSTRAKKVGLASNSFMSWAAWRRARKSWTNCAWRGEWPIRQGSKAPVVHRSAPHHCAQPLLP